MYRVAFYDAKPYDKPSFDLYGGMHGVRFSMSPYKEQEWMTNYPLPAVEAALS